MATDFFLRADQVWLDEVENEINGAIKMKPF
jgi:hypothetical protein